MIYDRHPEVHSKWEKAFSARGYYVVTIGNVSEEAIKRYIVEQSEESKRDSWPLLAADSIKLATSAVVGEQYYEPCGALSITIIEMVVMT